MSESRRLDRRLLGVAVVAAVVLASASTLTWGAAAGQLTSDGGSMTGSSGRPSSASTCSARALPGTVVGVVTADLGGRMWRDGRWRTSPGGSGSGPDSMMGGGSTDPTVRGGSGWPMRMMAVSLNRPSVPAGAVSLRVRNVGVMVHEVVVLPLAAGREAGERTVRADGTVAERGLGAEAARSCGAGDGDGIAPGAAGWVTVSLRPGWYELLCNLPGHYATGMYVTLHVT